MDKDREGSLTSCHHGQTRHSWGYLLNLSPFKSTPGAQKETRPLGISVCIWRPSTAVLNVPWQARQGPQPRKTRADPLQEAGLGDFSVPCPPRTETLLRNDADLTKVKMGPGEGLRAGQPGLLLLLFMLSLSVGLVLQLVSA